MSESDLRDDTLSFQILYQFFLKTPSGSHLKELILLGTRIDDHSLGLLSDPGKEFKDFKIKIRTVYVIYVYS